MTRLIDADALKKKIITTLCDFIACGNCPFYEETCLVGDWIDDAPTIDVVPRSLYEKLLTIDAPQTNLISRAEVKAMATKFFGQWDNFEKKIDALPSADAVSREEVAYTDGVITIEKQSAKDVGEIKHIVVCSPNYTRYFYNESMPLPSAEAGSDGVIYYEGKSFKGGTE